MKKEILIKFLNNQCTDTQLNEVIQWANKEVLSEESKGWGFDDWNSYNNEDNLMDDEKFSLLFDKIQNKINFDNQEHKTEENGYFNFSVFTTWLTRAAAILLIPVLAFLFYTLTEKEMGLIKYSDLAVDSLEIVAPIGSRTVVQLSDGSKVHLNYGSKIKYPQYFSGDTREVVLIGEGYFNVAHNPEKPFIVKTEKLNVKALGTAFNILAYPGDDVLETTLVNGKVVLEQNESDGKTKTIGTMEPGQHVAYNLRSGEIIASKGNIDKYIAWKNGKLVFDNEPILKVTEKLNRMFNVDIEVVGNARDYTYTVTFVNDPLFLILDLMTETTPVTYKVFTRKKLADGTYSKQRIIIEERII